MAGLEELKKKLAPLFDAEKGFSDGSSIDPCESYMVSDGGTVNLLSRSCGIYNINELGLQKRSSWQVDEIDSKEKTYRCASHEMRIFGAIGSGASSVVQRAIHIPSHRILALKKINIFEKEKRQQLLNEIRTLCEAPCYQGLVEFDGAFYTPDSGQISIALEYMDGGSLADVLRIRKRIPEPVLSCMVKKLLHGLSYLHGVRHLVHRDIKPANLLVNLKGEPKITDFGISAGLENSMAMEKRQQLLNEIRTLCEAPCYQGLVEFDGAFYTPDSGQISIALEYMDGGSLADVLRIRKRIPEPVLSCMVKKLLHGLSYLHGVRHLVHRDIKPANLLVNLKGEPKITDFGISAGLENSMAMCATFVGTVTYMSPERIRNESYSYPADIWSLGLALFECGTGEFPYTANDGPVNLMLQILYDPSPSPSAKSFSPEFCSFIDACLLKDANARPTAEQLLSHPFVRIYEDARVDLAAFVQNVFDPIQKMKDLADMLTIHYYLLFDGPDELWHHAKTFYTEDSSFSFSDQCSTGPSEIFASLSNIRKMLAGDWPPERLVHVVEKLQCRAHGQDGVAIRVSGSLIIGNQFLICGDGAQAESMPNFKDLSIDIASKRMGTFQEQFILEPGSAIGCYLIARQELYIMQ
ncbi:Mitogen-activated protein kinase kinase [Thalictrum thalictroides]|uniref:mitogen-activated protein kinase kinase n=1 Tax=Thalictrum thalictroides TaxID=46969 RepID=A0A7J6XDT6_THATH|nr:Mitogen-activated protein kinase kinase [Thalictrum thalictroides]